MPASDMRGRRRPRKPRRSKSQGTDHLSPSRATCPGSTEGRTGPREPFPRCCIRSVTQELSMPDRATTETVAWSTLPDAELVALARRGQRGAFRELMQRCNQRLFRVARAVVSDDAEAEDVGQEALPLPSAEGGRVGKGGVGAV